MKPHKIVLLAKSQLNRIEFLFSKALIDSNLFMMNSLYEIMCWNHFMIRNKKSKISITIKSKTIHKTMLSYCLKCKKIQKVKIRKQWRLKPKE